MLLKGIIDYDTINYKEPTLTLLFPFCNFKCDKLNGCKVCQNNTLINEQNIKISEEVIWTLYCQNPLTKGFCLQGLEPLDSINDVLILIFFIRYIKENHDPIIIYTGYNKEEMTKFVYHIYNKYDNIIIKWGRYIKDNKPHYDEILGVNLASDNQYAEKIS